MKSIINKSLLFFLYIIILCCSCHKQQVVEDVVLAENSQINEEYVITPRKPLIHENRKITQKEYEEIKEYLPELIEGEDLGNGWYLYEIHFEESNDSYYQNFYQSFGNLFLKYRKEDYYFCNSGVIYFPITEVLYLYKQNDDFKLLGKKDITGIYDNKNNLKLKCPETANAIVGYTSQDLFEYPFSNHLCLKQDDFTIYPCDTFGNINIDYKNNTLTAISMAEILDYALREK